MQQDILKEEQQPQYSHDDENNNGKGTGIQLEGYNRLGHREKAGSEHTRSDDLKEISDRKEITFASNKPKA